MVSMLFWIKEQMIYFDWVKIEGVNKVELPQIGQLPILGITKLHKR